MLARKTKPYTSNGHSDADNNNTDIRARKAKE